MAPVTEDCEICGGKHDPAIHAATKSVRAWLKRRLQARFEPVAQPKLRTAGRRTEISIKPRETG
jgi:hypothetical protein